MNRRARRQQATVIARRILKNPPSEDIQVPSIVFKALKKEQNRR